MNIKFKQLKTFIHKLYHTVVDVHLLLYYINNIMVVLKLNKCL